MFCCMLRIREKLGLGGNKCYHPFYICKIFDEILEGNQRWVLSYIYLQSEKTRKMCDKEWKKIKAELAKGAGEKKEKVTARRRGRAGFQHRAALTSLGGIAARRC